MRSPSSPEGPDRATLRINFFRPRPGFMRREVTIIWITLTAWGLLTFGFPFYLSGYRTDPSVTDTLAKTVFGIPTHYWYSGQFLILWFILICFVFNVLIDWLTESYRRRR